MVFEYVPLLFLVPLMYILGHLPLWLMGMPLIDIVRRIKFFIYRNRTLVTGALAVMALWDAFNIIRLVW